MSRFPVFEGSFDTPVAELVEKRGICLPSAGNVEEQDVDFVCENLKKFIENGV
jgi:dTDP-4-amino-4,6-dideoxygalactose transaminase